MSLTFWLICNTTTHREQTHKWETRRWGHNGILFLWSIEAEQSIVKKNKSSLVVTFFFWHWCTVPGLRHSKYSKSTTANKNNYVLTKEFQLKNVLFSVKEQQDNIQTVKWVESYKKGMAAAQEMHTHTDTHYILRFLCTCRGGGCYRLGVRGLLWWF